MTTLPRQNLVQVSDSKRPYGFRLRFYLEDRVWETDWFSANSEVTVDEVFDTLQTSATSEEKKALKKFLGPKNFKEFFDAH